MKLNKKILLFLGIAIFVILGVSLGMVQSQQAQERNQLEQDLSLAQLRLNKGKDASQELFSQQEDLENRLTQARSQLTTAKAGLFQLIETIEVNATLFEIAETCGVEIIEITSSAPADKELEGIPCSALTLRVRIEGRVINLLDFVRKWTETFHTGEVVSVGITPVSSAEGEGQAEEETIGEEETGEEQAEKEKQPSTNIELLIYTYRGN